MNLFNMALAYATGQHEGQVRKYTNTPYIRHPVEVAYTVRSVGGSEEMIAAALLHDVVEDTNSTHEDVRELFGPSVESYVRGMTQFSVPSDGNRAIRKNLDIRFLEQQCPEVQTIKLADINDNMESIIVNDPEFAKVFMSEVRDLMFVLRRGDVLLYNFVNKQVIDYYKEYGDE
ncbi:MAG: HD domain-containing protein [Cycloclasticus sp.]|nr:HD domain-containing protein [Cycloclasticus sp.]